MDKKPEKIRGFNKANLISWIINFEKDGYFMCSFKNCNFMAFDVDEIALHYSTCILDPKCSQFLCNICSKGCSSSDKLLLHKVLQHPNVASYNEIQEFSEKEEQLLPCSKPGRRLTTVMKRSWEVCLEVKKYVKCLVPTCLYVTDSVEMMECHFMHNCTPEYRSSLTHTCISCRGRLESLDELNNHYTICRHVKEKEKKDITPEMCQYWSEVLLEFKWARCFSQDCFFIDCDINSLKGHYAVCFSPTPEHYLKCDGCHGWLNGVNKLIQHISTNHNPAKPLLLTYMKTHPHFDKTSRNLHEELTEPDNEQQSEIISDLAEVNEVTRTVKKYNKNGGSKINQNINVNAFNQLPASEKGIDKNSASSVKQTNSTLEKIAHTVLSNNKETTLVPVNIKVKDHSWTMQVSDPKISAEDLVKLNVVPNFQKEFWNAVNKGMDEMLKETSVKACIRNRQNFSEPDSTQESEKLKNKMCRKCSERNYNECHHLFNSSDSEDEEYMSDNKTDIINTRHSTSEENLNGPSDIGSTVRNNSEVTEEVPVQDKRAQSPSHHNHHNEDSSKSSSDTASSQVPNNDNSIKYKNSLNQADKDSAVNGDECDSSKSANNFNRVNENYSSENVDSMKEINNINSNECQENNAIDENEEGGVFEGSDCDSNSKDIKPNRKPISKPRRKSAGRPRKRKKTPKNITPVNKRRKVKETIPDDFGDSALNLATSQSLLESEIKIEVVDHAYDLQTGEVQEKRSEKPKRKRQSKFSHLGEDYIIPHDISALAEYGHTGNYSDYDDFTPVRSRRGSVPENIVVPVDISLMEGGDGIIQQELVTPRRSRRSHPASQSSLKKQKSSAAAELLLTLGDRITASSPLKKPSLQVKCAICSEEMTAYEYQNNHLTRHNFMCWLESEVPLPLDDYAIMSLLINRGKRKFPSYNLTCEKCGMSKKSAMGFISHVQFCGKSVEESQNLKLPCPVCNKTFKPSCMDQHLILNHKVSSDQPINYSLEKAPPRSAAVRCLEMFETNLERPIKMEPEEPEILYIEHEDANFVSPNVDYRALNSMWKEALGKDNIIFCPNSGCEFASASLAEMKKHHKKCELNGAYQPFSCKLCHFKAQSRETLRAHIKAEHSNQLSSTNTESVYPIPYLKIVEEELYSSFSWIRQTSFLRPAVHWTRDIRKSVHSEEPLFPALRVTVDNWELLQDSEDYLHALSQSIHIKFESCDWTRLNLFGTLNDAGNSSVIWSGGPVWSLAWCPTPENEVREQYLAVSSHLAPSLSYQIGNTYSHPATIQLWSYGLLINNRKRDEEPMLSYSLCVDDGCIWDMEWCPSGCHDDRRLGLLATAFSSGAIHIFSIPHPYQLPPTDASILMYKAPPILKLQLPASQNVQCKRVSWSKVKPHKIVVGGFVNGLVAVWDLSISSSLLRHGCVLYPCRIFQPHHSTVTCLSMSPLSNDHLLTGSMDRTLKLWDLRDITAPLQCVSKGCYTDAVWLTHWLCVAAGLDGGYINSASTGLFTSIRDFSFLPASILNSITTTVMSISSCDWLNCAAYSFEDGYVAAVFGIRQMGDGTEATKRRAKYIVKSELSTIPTEGLVKKETPAKNKEKSKDKEKELENLVPKNSSSYEESASLFGVQISLSKNIDDNFKPMKSDEDIRHDIYSIQSANKVCFNPNAQSFLSFAVGYESGFVIVPSLILPNSNNALINEVLPKKK